MDAQQGTVVSVNVGRPRTVEWFGRQVTSSIWKDPVEGSVEVAGENLTGDDQADRRVHGGPFMAVYAYAGEDYDWWSEQLGEPLAPGTFGENLTLRGVDLSACAVGGRWQVGTATLRVTQPRFPCFKLGIRIGDADFVDRFSEPRRFGAYFAIEEAGAVAAGDPVRLLDEPADRLTIGEFIDASEDNDPEGLRRLADHESVPPGWREHAAKALARTERTR
jgi:MOSC domain-containing protein YiiM